MSGEEINKAQNVRRELSIQVTPSGFSFLVAQDGVFLYGSQARSYDFATIIGNTDRFTAIHIGWSCSEVIMVPAEVFDAAYAREYLRAANMIAPNLRAMFNHNLNDGKVAVWAANTELVSLIESLMPQAYHYHNLQLDIAEARPESVKVTITEDIASIVINTRDGLYAAESIEFQTPEDLLFMVERLNSVDKFARHSLDFTAADSSEFEWIFKPQYPNCKFCSNPNIYHQTILKCE